MLNNDKSAKNKKNIPGQKVLDSKLISLSEVIDDLIH